jgi:SAM-dependent methyltransferase
MPTVPQATRAAFDFWAALGAYAATTLYTSARDYYDQHRPRHSTNDPEARLAAARQAIAPSGEFAYNRVIQRLMTDEVPELTFMTRVRFTTPSPVGEDQPASASTIELDPGLAYPEYFAGKNFHNQPRDMIYAMSGAMSGGPANRHADKPIQRAGWAAVRPGSDLLDQRRRTAELAPRDSYQRILDVGCGHGTWTATLQARFPKAEIHAIDLWPGALRATRAIADRSGWRWSLRQAAAETTGYPDDFFDLAASYAVLHELPVAALEAVFAEMFRILEPGGDLLFMDVPPYRELDDFDMLINDWETEHRPEPYWRQEAMFDRAALCRRLGFISVEEFGIGEKSYPWILRARKPGGVVT